MVDLAHMQPIASHYAILLHDRHLRGTVALGQEPQRRDGRLTLAGVTNRAGSGAATFCGALADLPLARTARTALD